MGRQWVIGFCRVSASEGEWSYSHLVWSPVRVVRDEGVGKLSKEGVRRGKVERQ